MSACKNTAGNNDKRRLFLQHSKKIFEGALMCIINNISPACISEDVAETSFAEKMDVPYGAG